MKLRVRDTKSSQRRCKRVASNQKSRVAKCSTESRDTSQTRCLEEGVVLNDCCFDRSFSFFTARCHYASSHTNASDVTFVTTKGPRVSTVSTYKSKVRDIESCSSPLDLSLCNQSDCKKTESSILDDLDYSEDLSFSPYSCIGNERNSSNSPDLEIDRRIVSSVSKTICEFGKKLPCLKMLSSRRHRSDETFQDRENVNSIGRNSSYPRSAEAWLDSRCSPDRIDGNDFAAEQSDESESARGIDSNAFEEPEEESGVEEQEVAFNYSTKNRTSESTPEKNSEAKLMKAKRERIENVVTSIKDKPNREMNTDAFAADSDLVINSQSKKRKMGEQIRQLQKQLELLKKEHKTSEEYDIDSNCYDLEDELIDQTDDWSPHQKRPKYANEVESLPDSSSSFERGPNGFYRGSINLMLPQNGHRPGADLPAQSMAYQVLVQSIKQELASALEKVAEKSAKRILVEFHKGSGVKANLSRNDDLGTTPNDHRSQFTPKRSADNGAIAMTTQNKISNPSVMLYANEVGSTEKSLFSDQMKRGMNKEGDSRKPKPVSKALFERDEPEEWEKQSDEKRNSPENKRNCRAFDSQTQALSLVMKKSSSPLSTKSSPTPEDRPFVIRDAVDRASSGPPSPRHDRENSAKDFSRAYREPISSNPSSNSAKTQLDTTVKGKLLHPSLFSDSGFYSSPSSAFRLPLRNDPSLRREPFSSSSMLKGPPFSFGASLYPSSAAHSQPMFPFSTGQLPFPLLQSFQQRSLANALADYGRLREGFEPGSNRPVSTRTSTREPSRTSNLGRSHHGHKSDHMDFRASSSEVSRYSAASVQEGLTPQHLKKAKLMFFYTRYPSATALKEYFSDVNFCRATTSQLIKWFSNFREFYYIQMEKFARQALTDGVTNSNQLHVTRDSELFRVLNLHYNKSNDFRVPNEFLTVTLRSLQEFFLAIQMGKDSDNSWKKVIYKVICKLDQQVPPLFKLPNVLERLDEIGN